MSLVIQAARASPIASEDENPEPLHPLATHRPGRSGTGPTTKRPSGLMVNSPPRCSATGVLSAAGASAATWPASLRSTPRSSGTSSVLNEAGLLLRVDRQRAGLEPADHEPATGRA